MDFRVGIGFDAHGLAAGRRLVLGGVEVPYDRGLVGHSDGDALAHAIMDALLGAAGLGDKGVHFPPSDPQYKDISSLVLLTKVAGLLAAAGWRISNVDATMLAQKPRLAPFIPVISCKYPCSVWGSFKAPWTVAGGWWGCRPANPGRNAISSLTLGLYFIVQLPRG